MTSEGGRGTGSLSATRGTGRSILTGRSTGGSPRSSATPAMVTSSSPPPMAPASPAPDVPGLGPPGVQLGGHTGQAGHHQEPKKFEKLRQKLEDNIKEERKQKKFVFVHRNKEERSKKIEEYPEVQKTEDEVKSFNSNQSLTTP